MGLKEWLIPQEKKFFDLLEEESSNVIAASKQFLDLTKNPNAELERADAIKEIEHKNDEVVHDIFSKLTETFITPFDRYDISELATSFDDVIDLIHGCANRIRLYKVLPDGIMREFAEIIVTMAEELSKSPIHIKTMNMGGLTKMRVQIHTLENQADDLLNESVAQLFELSDVKEIIKHKEIYEMLEKVTDKCEDVSDVIADIVLEGK